MNYRYNHDTTVLWVVDIINFTWKIHGNLKKSLLLWFCHLKKNSEKRWCRIYKITDLILCILCNVCNTNVHVWGPPWFTYHEGCRALCGRLAFIDCGMQYSRQLVAAVNERKGVRMRRNTIAYVYKHRRWCLTMVRP